MATVTANVIAVELIRGADDAFAGEDADANTGTALKRAVVYIDNGSSAMAGGDVLSCDLGAAIQSNMRNGKTVTVRDAAVYSNGHDGTAGGWYAFKSSTVTSNTATLIPTAADYTTNKAIAAGALVRKYAWVVSFSDV